MRDDEIWVYQYKYWDNRREELVASDYAATLDAIKSGLGIPILTSGLKVHRHQLEQGRRIRLSPQRASP